MPGFLDAPAGQPRRAVHRARRRRARRSGRRASCAVLRRLAHRGRLDDLAAARTRCSAVRRRRARAVAAGRPPTRHYYQRDVHYGTTGIVEGGGRRPQGRQPSRSASPACACSARARAPSCGSRPAATARPARASRSSRSCTTRRPITASCATASTTAVAAAATKTTAIEPPHPARQVVAVADGPHKLTLEHGGGGALDLFGVVLERVRPGVIVDSLGVVGRRLGSLRSWDWSVIGEQLATRDPRLVVLQYGTNEADDPDLDLEAIARYYDETILRIRAAAPTASILILGPPDMGAREGGKACDKLKQARRADDPRVRVAHAARARRDHRGRARGRRCATTSRSSTRSPRWAAPTTCTAGSPPSPRSRTRTTSTSPTSATSGGPTRCRGACSPDYDALAPRAEPAADPAARDPAAAAGPRPTPRAARAPLPEPSAPDSSSLPSAGQLPIPSVPDRRVAGAAGAAGADLPARPATGRVMTMKCSG